MAPWFTLKGIESREDKNVAKPWVTIPIDHADEMFRSVCEGMQIEKTRYDVPHAGLIWEVHVYKGLLKARLTNGNFQTCNVLGLDDAIGAAQATQRDRITGQTSLFDMGGPAAGATERPEPQLPEVPRWAESERLTREKEILGFFISGHPLERFRDEVRVFGMDRHRRYLLYLIREFRGKVGTMPLGGGGGVWHRKFCKMNTPRRVGRSQLVPRARVKMSCPKFFLSPDRAESIESEAAISESGRPAWRNDQSWRQAPGSSAPTAICWPHRRWSMPACPRGRLSTCTSWARTSAASRAFSRASPAAEAAFRDGEP